MYIYQKRVLYIHAVKKCMIQHVKIYMHQSHNKNCEVYTKIQIPIYIYIYLAHHHIGDTSTHNHLSSMWWCDYMIISYIYIIYHLLFFSPFFWTLQHESLDDALVVTGWILKFSRSICRGCFCDVLSIIGNGLKADIFADTT